MLDILIVLGGMAYAGYQARQEQKEKATQAAAQKRTAVVSTQEVKTGPEPEAKPSNDYQALYERDDQHYLKVTGAATGLSLISIIYPPVGIAALGLLTYLAIPLFRSAYISIFIEHKPRSSTVDAISWAACLFMGLYVLAAIVCIVFFSGFQLALRNEQRTRHKLVNAFREAPHTVWILHGDMELEVPFETVQSGDVMVLQAGEFIPIDGKVLRGLASVDQRTLTGEAHPIEKSEGDRVFASTTVVSGKMFVSVEHTGAETQAANIQKVLDQTEDFKSSVESNAVQFADSLATPTLVAGGITTAFLGPISGSALVGCNLTDVNRLTAPLGIINFLEISLDKGILIKDGRCLELLRHVDTVVFDKTGTLTLNEPHINAIHVFGELTAETLLRYAAAAEQRQTHPIANAILATARQRMIQIPELDDARYEFGLGVRVELEQNVIHVGSARFMASSGNLAPQPDRVAELQTRAGQHGASLVYVAVNSVMEGAIELHSTIRPEARRVIQQLRARNLAVMIISGDHESPTRRLADQLGIDRVYAGVLPAEKAFLVEALRQEGRAVCFIGDGVNDAVALKTANVSISIHGASDAALDTAGVVFLDGTLDQLCPLFELSDELARTQKYDYYATSIPGIAGAAGVIFLGLGLPASLIMYMVGLGAGVTTAMWPRISRKLGIKH